MPVFLKTVLVKLIKNPETLKKLIKWLVILLFVFIALPAAILNSVSSILKDDVVLDENYDIASSVVYQTVVTLTDEILAEIRTEMNAIAQGIIDDNTYEDEDGDEVCDVTVTVEGIYGFDVGYILAYLSVKHETEFTEDYRPSKEQIKGFIDSIVEIQTLVSGDHYTIRCHMLSFEEIVDQVFATPAEKEQFEASYAVFTDFVRFSQANPSGEDPGLPGSGLMGSPGVSGNGVSITYCHPVMVIKMNQLVEECARQGLTIRITQTYRTVEQQDALYAQGRTKPGNIVTNARGSSYSSMHQWGIAFDFCRNDGRGAYNDSDGFFRKVGQIGKSLGLEWGGDWTSFVDKPHFQLPDWGSSASGLKRQYGNPQNFANTWR